MAHLTEQQAFDAMREFLMRHLQRAHDGGVAGLLGDLEPMPDGRPADEALWADWKEVVETVTSLRPHRDAAE